ncbi:WD_REPEATS_REGION domain-containing protein [Caenorhabditis elegans]|uniref:WD_REPEATS_REGION domain-containing protein n=1 Tax=Caenorhabditis elegans TaxID=6239 RepID=Q9N4T4_CAEEL|nr:WD_REPEATS_REGION domain-containing protein [Caenorhabditis elegans]CCD63557.2 WD_REPEATS_REGION domain-containing protein [Caenorhabditis elegans]
MEDVTLFQFTWRKPIRLQGEIVYKTSETQTIETNKKDVECVANFQENKEVQTDSVDNGVGENVKKDITISKEVLNLLYDFVRDDSKVNYDRLLEFHKFDKVALETVQKYHVETRNENIILMISSSSRKTLILFGGISHETFCSHQARALLCSSSTSFSIPLPVCAISAVFYSSTQFILGDVSGNISMCSKDKIIFEKKITDGAVTCLEMCRHGLLSGSDDGNIILWQIGTSGLEKLGGTKLTVSDLSRKIRRSSTSNKPVAIVSMQVSGEEACVATETGGLYLLTLPTLDYKPLSHQTATSINKILFENQFVAVIYHTSNAAVFNSEGLVDEIPFVATLAVRCGPYFIFSDRHRLLIWSQNTRSRVIDENGACHAICALSNDTLQLLDVDFNLVSNFLNDKL